MRNLNTVSSPYSIAETQASFMRRVYTWMAGGVLLTALISSYLGTNPELVIGLIRNPILFYGLMIAQLAMVITLSAAVARLSSGVATMLFVGYAALTGVTLSTIFLVYTRDSIAGVFLSTACGFGGLSLLGYTTKRDLGPVGAFCGMALFGMIGWALLSFFFPSLMGGNAGMVYSILGVVVFAGLTAYDVQKIKMMALGGFGGYGAEAYEAESKAAVLGALALYLDFINLFLSLLRLFGDRRR
jgi:FtsH-binding integral membrane protein